MKANDGGGDVTMRWDCVNKKDVEVEHARQEKRKEQRIRVGVRLEQGRVVKAA